MKKNIIISFIFVCMICLLKFEAISGEKEKYIKIRDQIVKSFLKRNPDSIYYADEPKSQKWNYEQGLMLEAFRQLWLSTGDKEIINYIKKNLDHYIDQDGKILTYRLNEFNIDNITQGRACLFMYDITQEAKYKIAADTLRKQLQLQPRTSEGGFWHKKIYPNQMWLDGLYMSEPFYVSYSRMINDTAAYNDILNQFFLAYKHTYDKKTGLLYHAWDESKTQKWANPKTGQSPNFWGRAIGWYMMAITDVLDVLPPDHPKRYELINIFKQISSSLLKYRDKKTGLWYQLVNFGGKEKNYLESSASSMFIFSFIKGVNKGYLDKSYADAAEKSFDGLITNLTSTDDEGNINLLNTCQVGGLGGNPYRDGSYRYYMSEPKRTNDFKGYGPFMLAAIEIARYEENKDKPKVALDYYFNHEYKDGRQFHYIWEDTANGGYSQLGEIITKTGGVISSNAQKPDKENLKNINVYILVDPDWPKENKNPNYIDESSIKTFTEWVKNGGVLLIFANDSNNCEFVNLNKLTGKFGIKVNGDSRNRVQGKEYATGTFDKFSDLEIFAGLNKIYLKEISTLSVKAPAKPLLVEGKDVIMAGAEYGKGFVFAVGDPWFYNEYMDHRKLPEGYENDKAAANLFGWVFKKYFNKK
jgi:unsaturated rhamnogalacturonyl hydrolase